MKFDQWIRRFTKPVAKQAQKSFKEWKRERDALRFLMTETPDRISRGSKPLGIPAIPRPNKPKPTSGKVNVAPHTRNGQKVKGHTRS